MTDFLQEAIKQKKRELSAGYYSYRKIKGKSQKSFKFSIKRPRLALIAEIKKSSPRKGPLILSEERIKTLLKFYELFADSISVVVDKKFFAGSLDLLNQISQNTCLPVLAKDFIIDERQIQAIKNAGANAILLILKMLSFQNFAKLYKFSRELELDVVCEVSSKKEIAKVKKLGAEIFGINNRNLKSLKVNLETSGKLAEFIPESSIIVAESGFSRISQIKSKRINSVLVGTSLIKSKNLTKTFSNLSDKKPRIKICGLKTVKEAEILIKNKIDFAGLNFVESSKRFIAPARAKELSKILVNRIKLVGIFKDERPEKINQIAKALNLSFIQLYGSYSFYDYKKIIVPVIKPVLRYKDDYKEYQGNENIVCLLFESATPGSGKSWDWHSLKNYQGKLPFFVAGNINPDNAQEILETIKPFGLDIASGVEDNEQKSEEKIKKLLTIYEA